MAADYTIDGVTFAQDALSVDDACAGIDLLSHDGGMAKMGLLAKSFATVTKVSRTKDGRFDSSGDMVPMKAFVNDVFRGRLDLLVAFVERAVQVEYGAFLAKAGVQLPSFTAPQTPTP